VSEIVDEIPPTKLRVHLAPVGFEEDRVVLPAIKMKADKIYLIQLGGLGKVDRAQFCVDNIKVRLAEKGFVEGDTLFVIPTDIFDLYSGLNVMAEIFGYEQGLGNDIFFNASSGGHHVSFAGWLACMLWGGTPYYCSPANWDYLDERDKPLTSGMEKISTVPTFHIAKPEDELLGFLSQIVNYLDQKENLSVVSSRICVDLLAGDDPDLKQTKDKPRGSKEYNKVKLLITKLIDKRYAEYADPKRKKIKITTEGKQALLVFETYTSKFSSQEPEKV
jgi:hypothetical protein